MGRVELGVWSLTGVIKHQQRAPTGQRQSQNNHPLTFPSATATLFIFSKFVELEGFAYYVYREYTRSGAGDYLYTWALLKKTAFT